MKNYIIRGIWDLKDSVIVGIFLYLILYVLFSVIKKDRRNFSAKSALELVFVIYCITILKVTGIFHLHFDIQDILNGFVNINLIPFIGSSIVPAILNFLLFVPYGFLLSCVFKHLNWKKVLAIGAATSFCIELVQLFGGRYAEIDDLLLNAFGAFTGYILFTCVLGLKKNIQKSILSFLLLCIFSMLGFGCIYILGDNAKTLPDGLEALEGNIHTVCLYHDKDYLDIGPQSNEYNQFVTQINNCGGHQMLVKDIEDDNILNSTDYYIEIICDEPCTLQFENAKDFVMQDVDRILYNTDENILYWGNSSYQNMLDFMLLDAELEEYRQEIRNGYEQINQLVRGRFDEK